MIRRKTVILPLVAIFITLAGLGGYLARYSPQSLVRIQNVNIAVSTHYSRVIEELGEPLSREGFLLGSEFAAYYFHYEGLRVSLRGGVSNHERVTTIAVFSPKYRLGGRVGLRVGDSKANVERAAAWHRVSIAHNKCADGKRTATIRPTVIDIIIIEFDQSNYVTSIAISQLP